MPTRTNAARRPRRGSEQVKAWVYSVVNPLMEALRAENTLLSKKNIPGGIRRPRWSLSY